MTQTHTVRARRAMRTSRHRLEHIEMNDMDLRALACLILALLVAACIMALANWDGPTDAELDAAEVQMWQERGVEIGRW